jgi:urea-proton symporter
MWVIDPAIVFVIKPLIEGKIGIIQVVKMICLSCILRIRSHPMQEATQANSIFREKQSQNYFENSKRILVLVDGSIHSLKALNGAAGLFDNEFQTNIFALNVIEWTDEEEESLDSEMTSRIVEEGRRMLRSVVIPTESDIFERIVKVGDHSSKIVQLADKLDVDYDGKNGIGNSNDDIGHVARRVLKITSKPVVLFK